MSPVLHIKLSLADGAFINLLWHLKRWIFQANASKPEAKMAMAEPIPAVEDSL